jgi:UDP-2,4-diacetamido-2,4,6-trideoxy-beta-L-altropyranose hydrolase
LSDESLAVVFRADASARIGFGHVARCLTLARALRARGVAVLFVARSADVPMLEHLDREGITVARVPNNGGLAGSPPEDPWPEVGSRRDAEQTRDAILAWGRRPQWIVADHYGIDEGWETVLRPHVDRIMVIDDLANRRHDCDLLLDQNLVDDLASRHVGRVPTRCGLLLGPEFALLQPAYAALHDTATARRGAIRRLLISFGGADAPGLTMKTLEAVGRLAQPAIHVDVVSSSASPWANALRQAVVGHDQVHLHFDLPSLANLMAEADFAIGAGGSTTWERLCLGLPTLVVTLAKNQEPAAAELDRRGLIHWLGDAESVTVDRIHNALATLMENGLPAEWSERCHAAVDGEGAKRVVAALCSTATTEVRARRARDDDERLLLSWANDPVTRQNSFSTQPIPAETHHRWFRDRLADQENCRLYVVETLDGVPIGQVRLQRMTPEWEIHYGVAQMFRGRGLGRSVLSAALEAFHDDVPTSLVVGRVKLYNKASHRTFEALGFEQRPSSDEHSITFARQF